MLHDGNGHEVRGERPGQPSALVEPGTIRLFQDGPDREGIWLVYRLKGTTLRLASGHEAGFLPEVDHERSPEPFLVVAHPEHGFIVRHLTLSPLMAKWSEITEPRKGLVWRMLGNDFAGMPAMVEP